MVCIGKRPHILYGRSSAFHFRYLTCLLDKGHIKWPLEKLYSFDTFLEMTILRRIEEPENFMLRNTAWDEEKF